MSEKGLQVRVRFDETDSMDYLYHGNYAKLYHISRTEMLRPFGLDDKTLKSKGFIMPVISLNVKYKKPAVYDDILWIQTTIESIKVCKITFLHKVRNEQGEVINEGTTTVAFVDDISRKPIRIPESIDEQFNNAKKEFSFQLN
jgi:acyl-CoA thioester hydrolase